MKKKIDNRGYALLTAILAVAIFTVMLMKARTLWETEIVRDNEQELLFRAQQYVIAIELFRKKNPNLFPLSLEELYEKNFLRKRFKDPMTLEGKWNVVMRPSTAGAKQNLWVVPEDMVPQYIAQANIIGVCSTSCEEGFKEYRKKKKYCEWAVYLGEQVDKDMPELKFLAEGDKPDEDENQNQSEFNRQPTSQTSENSERSDDEEE